MPFVKGKSGNPKGRGTGKDLVNPKSLAGTEYREKEFKQILRRLKPLNNKALKCLQICLKMKRQPKLPKLKLQYLLSVGA